MSHLHVPDGVLPGDLLVAGFAAAVLMLAWAAWALRRCEWGRLLPRLAAVAALLLAAMSVPLGVLPYHLNLTVLAGILLGRAGSIIVVACVGLFLALLGHGGITVLGLNTALLAIEAAVGRELFYIARRFVGLAAAAALATAATLLAASAAAMAVVTAALGSDGLAVERFVSLTTPLVLLGVGIEAVIVGGVVGFLARVRPDLVAVAAPRTGSRPASRQAPPGPPAQPIPPAPPASPAPPVPPAPPAPPGDAGHA